MYVNCLIEDSNGFIYIGFEKGLYVGKTSTLIILDSSLQ